MHVFNIACLPTLPAVRQPTGKQCLEDDEVPLILKTQEQLLALGATVSR